MSVGLLVITHNNIGHELLETARIMLNTCPLQTADIAISVDCDPVESLEAAQQQIQDLDQGEGVLVLTDMYGSTPSNIAHKLADNNHVIVISGINLPMLVRTLNYPRLKLEALAEKARSGGHDGIIVS